MSDARKLAESEGRSEGVPGWAAALGDADRFRRFMDTVRAHFATTGDQVEWGDGQVRVLGGELSGELCGLQGLAQKCALTDLDEWGAAVARHFESLVRSRQSIAEVEPTDYSAMRERLVLRAWDSQAASEYADLTVCRELAPGLVAVLAIDLPDSVATVKPDTVQAWGIGNDAAFDQAERNVLQLADAHAAWHDLQGVRLMVAQGESVYNAATVRSIDRFEGALGRHGAFVSTPTRHTLLSLPFEQIKSMQNLIVLLAVTTGMERDGPGSVSRRVWWCRRLGSALAFSELQYNLEGDRPSVLAPDELAIYLNTLDEDER